MTACLPTCAQVGKAMERSGALELPPWVWLPWLQQLQMALARSGGVGGEGWVSACMKVRLLAFSSVQLVGAHGCVCVLELVFCVQRGGGGRGPRARL